MEQVEKSLDGAADPDIKSASENTSGPATAADETQECDSFSDIDPADLIDTVNMIREIEQSDHDQALAAADSPAIHVDDEESSKKSVSPIGPLSTGTTLTQLWRQNPDPTKAASSRPKVLLTKALVRPIENNFATKARKNSQIEVLQLPQPKRQHNQRKKKTQERLKTKAKPQRLSAIELPDKAIPSLARVLEWASNTNDIDSVIDILAKYPVIMEDDFIGARNARCQRAYVRSEDFDYNFVIPNRLVIKLDAVIEEEKLKRQKSTYFGGNTENEYPEGTTEEIVAYFPGGLPKFTSGAVYKMKLFYNIRKLCGAWLADMKWLSTTKWEEISASPELFDEETDSEMLLADAAGKKHQTLAADVSKVLGEACLSSLFRLTSASCSLKLENLVGMVARDRMLNDLIINFSIRSICSSLGDCYAMDSFAAALGYRKPPMTRISSMHYIVMPVHLSYIHWGIIIVRLAYQRDVPSITPHYYEPQCSSAYRATMEDAYAETVARFIREWHTATMPLVEFPVEESGVWLEAPRQPDGTSCGVLCIAQAYSVLKDSFRLARCVITREDVAVMRLRIMWIILMQPDESTRSNKLAKSVQATDIELLATIRT